MVDRKIGQAGRGQRALARRPLRLLSLLILASALAGVSHPAAQQQGDDAEPEQPPPRDIGLAERAGRRLAQIDITVAGPPDRIADLTADDFSIRINLRKLREFQVDRLCDPGGSSPPAGVDEATAPTPTAVAPAATYLFYFDQPLLTMSGRQRSIDVARELVGRLVTDGVQAMIVSNSRATRIVQPLTGDRELLDHKLDELLHDRDQWDMYAHHEDQRVDDVVRKLNDDNNLNGAMTQARLYQMEESWYMQRSMRRLTITLGQLVDLDAPKALIYFADTVRSNPGEHYLSFFGENLRASQPILAPMSAGALTGGLVFDEVINAAAAQGIRVYTIEAQGLRAEMDSTLPNPGAMYQTRTVTSPSRVRFGDTHRTLEGLAAETGGRAFLHGVGAGKIADRILSDSSCLYLASFDPSGFPQDAPLRLSVAVDRPDVELRVRGRLVLQSETKRKTSELLRAFSNPDSIADPFDIDAGLVPTGFSNGTYSALLQIRVPGSPLLGAVWDVGASLVSDDKVYDKVSSRISPEGQDVSVILEREWRLKPGDYDLVAVAQEVQSGLVASTRVSVSWPSLARNHAATIGPIVLLQPARGAFVRDGKVRGSGSVLIPEASPLRSSDPAAFVGLVCRGKRTEPLRVTRSLVGETTHEFPDLEMGYEEQPCAQVRDVVPSNTVRPGYYRYEIRVWSSDETVATATRPLVVRAAE